MKFSNVISKSTLRRIILSFLLVIPMSTHAAIYMYIDGVNGDVTAKGYEGWINVSTVQEGMSQVVDLRTGGGGSLAKVEVLDTTIVKVLDSTSPVLRQKLTESKAIPSVIISIVATADAAFVEYFRIELEKVYLTSISMSASGLEAPVEDMSVAFETIRWIYTPIAKDGTPGSQIVTGWDLVTNTPL
jgi:type VI secretion system secreted protein Hcp